MRPLWLLLGLICGACAHEIYRNDLPNGKRMSEQTGCYAYGHVNCRGGHPNAFGQAFQKVYGEWKGELCEADTDGDGYTNGEELGDPCCCWDGTDGSVARMDGLSHPSDETSVPPDSVPRLSELNCTCPQSSQVAGDGTAVPVSALIIVHGALMYASMGVVLPLSAILMRYRTRWSKGERLHLWFNMHRLSMFLALALALAGFVVIEIYQGGLVRARDFHAIAGLTVLGLVVLQEAASMLRPAKDPHEVPTAQRRIWHASHVAIAVGVVLLSSAVLATGLVKVNKAFVVLHALVIGCLLGVLVVSECRAQSARAEFVGSGEEPKEAF